MRPYELVVLLHPDLEIDIDSPVAKIEEMIKTGNGKITKKDNWGKKRLAYPINKLQFAVYVYFEFDLDPSGVRDIERQLLITEEVIRHLLVSHVEPPVVEEDNDTKKDEAVAAAAEEE
jgi:small subunit ribosomal protein S6